MAAIVKVTEDGIPNSPLADKELGYDKVTNELYVGSGSGEADGNKLSKYAGELQATRNAEMDLHMDATFAQHGLIPNDGVNEIRPADMFEEVDVPDVLVDKKGYPVRFSDGVHDRLGDELITNGDFSDGTNGWATDLVLEDGKFTSGSYIYQNLSLSYTKKYKITFYSSVSGINIGCYGTGGYNYFSQVNKGWNTYTVSPSHSNSRLQFDAFSEFPFILDNISVKELPQFQLPKAPFAQGSTSELLDDKVNGLVTQADHSKGDIVVTGSELVTNGGFDSDVSGWNSQDTSTISYSTGRALIDTSASYGGITQTIQTVVGAEYEVACNIELGTSGSVQAYIVSPYIDISVIETSGIKSLSATFVATATSTDFIARCNNSSGTFYIDNVSVKLKDTAYVALQNTAAGDTLDTAGLFGVNPSRSTDELLDDSRFGLTCQNSHSKGDIVVTGNELVENGGFDSDLSWWNDVNSNFSFVSGRAYCNPTSTYAELATPVLPFIPNTEYIISFDVEIVQGQCQVVSETTSVNGSSELLITSSGTYFVPYILHDEFYSISFTSIDTVLSEFYIDNVSIKLKDQSYIATRDTADMYDNLSSDTVIPYRGYPHIVLGTGNNNATVGHYYMRNDGETDIVNGQLDDFSVTTSWLDLGTALNMSLQNPCFKAIPYVTKQAALLIEKTSAGAIQNVAKPLVNCYGEESVETYEQDIFSELGYSQKADRVYTDGNSEFILLGLKGYLNAGAYHPWFNAFGASTYLKFDGTSGNAMYWYTADARKAASLLDTLTAPTDNYPFSNGILAPDNGLIGVQYERLGRPDLKFYDKTYIEGQGGLICYAIPNALTPTYKHQEEVRRNLVDGYVENGVEIIGINTASNWQEYLTGKFRLNFGAKYLAGLGFESFMPLASPYTDIIGRNVSAPNSSQITGYVATNTGNLYYITELNIDESSADRLYIENLSGASLDDLNAGYKLVLFKKSPYLATQGSMLHTDLIGDPVPYVSTDATYIANDGNTDTDVTDMPIDTLVWNSATSTMWKTKVDTIDLADSVPSVAIEEGDNWTEVKKGYPQSMRNLLASGKGVGFMNALLVGQDGSDYTDTSTAAGTWQPILYKKVIGNLGLNIFTSNGGMSFSPYNISSSLDAVANTQSGLSVTNTDATKVSLLSYKAQNQPAIPVSTPKPIETVDRDLIASNHHSVYAYNGLTYASSSKVATGSSIEAKGVDDVQLLSGYDEEIVGDVLITVIPGKIYKAVGFSKKGYFEFINPAIYTGVYPSVYFFDETEPTVWKDVTVSLSIPKHQALTLDANSIVGSKALITQTDNATQVFTQELDYDSTAGDFGDTDTFERLTDGTLTDLNGHSVQTKVLLKGSSIKLGE